MLLLFVVKDHIAVKDQSLPFIYGLPLPFVSTTVYSICLSIIKKIHTWKGKDQLQAKFCVCLPIEVQVLKGKKKAPECLFALMGYKCRVTTTQTLSSHHHISISYA